MVETCAVAIITIIPIIQIVQSLLLRTALVAEPSMCSWHLRARTDFAAVFKGLHGRPTLPELHLFNLNDLRGKMRHTFSPNT